MTDSTPQNIPNDESWLTVLKEEYGGLWDDLKRYFSCYGGVPKITASPYTHVALILTLLSWGKWHADNWTATPFAVLPALLGFTLAAYALLLGFGDESFRKFLAKVRKPVENRAEGTNTALIGVSAIFLHFVVVEIIALILAIVGEADPMTSLGWVSASMWITNELHLHPGALHHAWAFIGLWTFYLSILMSLAAAIGIFHATGWYVQYSHVVPSRAGGNVAASINDDDE